MKRLLQFVGLAIILAGLASAGAIVPPGPYSSCGATTLNNYTVTGFNCAIGNVNDGWVYFDWSFQRAFYTNNVLVAGFSGPSKMAAASDIMLTPPGVVTSGFGFSSSKFEVYGQDKAVYILEYKIDPFPPAIPSIEGDMIVESPQNGGIATILTEVCAGGLLGFGCPEPHSFPLVYETNPQNQIIQQVLSGGVTFSAPQQLVSVRHTIVLEARGGSSQITGLSSNVGGVVPEPGSFLLGGMGLGLLLLIRKRRSA